MQIAAAFLSEWEGSVVAALAVSATGSSEAACVNVICPETGNLPSTGKESSSRKNRN